MSEAELKRTPLHAAHVRAGARMVPFGGWDMPVQYTGLLKEHHAVREGVGVFDVSHMGEFRVRGPGALDFLQRATTNDVSKLKPGRAQYGLLPNDRGGLIDDLYVYMVAEQEYLIVVNAGNIERDFAHLQTLARDFDVTFVDESALWGLLAVQGPQAEATLQPHVNVDLSAKKKNAFFPATLFDLDVFMARTGYTGEDGFEVFVKTDEAEVVWDKLLTLGVVPAGLGARDTLRLEAGFPLYGHEFSDDTHPLSSGYGWAVKDKAFHGREHILDRATPERLIGLTLDKVPPREGYPVLLNGEVVGRVTSGTTSPTLKRPIAMALVRADAAEADAYEVEVRGKTHPATRAPLPFYKR
ncbi:glycine cleavage system aminomethyltransferase GcvT [Deinococcus maricopensis]|uniref:Aminomethyltransferase n=1 Tax=Deinococcus maricopensis (strain DSM 21211 / LMG 22137 / NRRL B-23946 / LB-34) TaxID=709986 RepID=E8U6G6_DEIML|nr:glycine cleavage system aminomethyltransferase GcvT [Deinococcus maricopensis]ADV66655.1 Aminomethyltransferase [Deinococcus maricopensis DSM 21211]